jgi:hypothetical protein
VSGRGQLEQRQRVAVGAPQQPVGNVGGHPPVQSRAEEGVGVALLEAAEVQLVEARRVEAAGVAVASGHQECDRLGLEAPRGEHERLCRGPVKPLGVVDAAEHRAVLAGLRQEAQQPDRDQEAIARAVEAQPQRPAQRGGLGRGEPVDEVQARPHQLVHPGKRQLVLGLDTHAAQQAHVVGALGGVLQQRRLADPRLTAQDQRGAALLASALQQRVQCALLSLSPDEHRTPILIRTGVGLGKSITWSAREPRGR